METTLYRFTTQSKRFKTPLDILLIFIYSRKRGPHFQAGILGEFFNTHHQNSHFIL